jgi:hypothetical protein
LFCKGFFLPTKLKISDQTQKLWRE